MLGLLHPLAGTPLKAHHDFVCHLSHGAQEPAPEFLRCVAHVYSSFPQLPLSGSQSISKIHEILHGEKPQCIRSATFLRQELCASPHCPPTAAVTQWSVLGACLGAYFGENC